MFLSSHIWHRMQAFESLNPKKAEKTEFLLKNFILLLENWNSRRFAQNFFNLFCSIELQNTQWFFAKKLKQTPEKTRPKILKYINSKTANSSWASKT